MFSNKLVVTFLAALTVAAAGVPLAALWRSRWHCHCPRHETAWRMQQLEGAMVAYRNENQDRCPASLASFAEQRFFRSAPVDGWEQPLIFVCPGVHEVRGADFTSAGADHVFGTADDLHSW